MVLHANTQMWPSFFLSSYHSFFLSSNHSGTRFQQSAVGTLFTSAIREDLNVDAAILNGATIKGNRLYEGRVLTYADLKKELPFPTKMVSVPMPGHVLEAAIQQVGVKWFISCLMVYLLGVLHTSTYA